MKGAVVVACGVLGTALIGWALRTESKPAPPDGSARSEGFAVIELFTSEGCSSCPPADENLARLIGDAKGRRVIALGWHVDYWDRLGWKDPFSDPSATARQRAYAAAWESRRIYTPQMVVNGITEFVGSAGGQADRAVAEALAKAGTVALTATARPGEGRDWAVTWAVEGAPEGCEVLVALTQDDRVTQVPRGENRGRTLRHEGVVRAFATAPAAPGKGVLILGAPADVGPDGVHLIALVQHRKTMGILAAIEVAR